MQLKQKNWIAICCAICLTWSNAATAEVPEAINGVLVEEIHDGALQEAGIQPGDLLLAWKRLSDSASSPAIDEGSIHTYFDWIYLAEEQAPRGRIIICGRRAGQDVEFNIGRGIWKSDVRPILPSDFESLYLEGKNLLDEGEVTRAVELWEKIGAGYRGEFDLEIQQWVALRIKNTWEKLGQLERSIGILEEALGGTPDGISRGQVLVALGEAYEGQMRLELAESTLLAARSVRIADKPYDLMIANTERLISMFYFRRGRLNASEEHLNRALGVYESLAPLSPSYSNALSSSGTLARVKGLFAVAVERHLKALSIRTQVAPGSSAVAESLIGLGVVYQDRGDMKTSRDYQEMALEILEKGGKSSENSMLMANVLGNLGLIAYLVGDEFEAADFLLRGLEFARKDGGAKARQYEISAWQNLGMVISNLGDLERAEIYYLESLKMTREDSPGGPSAANVLNNLAVLEQVRGDSERAWRYISEAIELKEKFAPGTIVLASSLANAANVALNSGRPKEATNLARRSVAIYETEGIALQEGYTSALNVLAHLAWKDRDYGLAAEFLQKALEVSGNDRSNLTCLGIVKYWQGKYVEAKNYLLRALESAPRSSDRAIGLAVAHEYLGATLKGLGDMNEALKEYHAAIEEIEKQGKNLGGNYEVQAKFGVNFREMYMILMRLLIQEGRLDEAFVVSERYRARVFLQMLAQRRGMLQPNFHVGLQPTDGEFMNSYDKLKRRLDVALGLKGGRGAGVGVQLNEAPDEKGELLNKGSAISPGLANAVSLKVFSADGIRATLDDGTIMLSYAVGKDLSVVFAVSRTDKIGIGKISATEDELRNLIFRFRELIEEAGRTSSISSVRANELDALGRQLYDLLVAPVSEQVDAHSRVLIIPDGPLHTLPFAALIKSRGMKSEYLVESKALHFAMSATAYTEIKRCDSATHGQVGGNDLDLLIFGDPLWDSIGSGGESGGPLQSRSPVVRSLMGRGAHSWEPLPHSRREVDAIAGTFTNGSVRKFLGSEAEEGQFKGLASRAKIIHIASHSIADERSPMSSFIAFSDPMKYSRSDTSGSESMDDGVLQVSEILNEVRTSAELVVLSSCQTGLGKELGGEGLLGLTRAFQLAGARSVVASLWEVSDRSTADLMINFYKEIRSGRSKDEALRAAQLALLNGAKGESEGNEAFDYSRNESPAFWAAFQVYGDWQPCAARLQ